MHRLRHLLLAMTLGALAQPAWSLSLGEVRLLSAPGQPLRGSIALGDSAGLHADELIVRQAPAGVYRAAGLPYNGELAALQLTVELGAGSGQIRFALPQPLRDPNTSLLIEVLWPDGRQLRAFRLSPGTPASTPATVAASSPGVAAAVVSPPRVVPLVNLERQPGGTYRTRSGDRLWDLALEIRGSLSPHQAMLAIQALNPQAFDQANINGLQAGQVLRLPTLEQMRQLPRAEALAEVQAQQQRWRQGPGERQLDAVARSQAGAAPARPVAGDTLTLVGANAQQAGGAGSEQNILTRLREQLAVEEEGLDQARREREELTSRLADLQSQLDKLQRLLALKDAQLAELQARLAAAEAPPEAAKSP